MQLIDFGRTVKAPADKANLKTILARDQAIATDELDFFNIETKGLWALDNPLHPKAAEYADDYAKALIHRRNPKHAAFIRKEFEARSGIDKLKKAQSLKDQFMADRPRVSGEVLHASDPKNQPFPIPSKGFSKDPNQDPKVLDLDGWKTIQL